MIPTSDFNLKKKVKNSKPKHPTPESVVLMSKLFLFYSNFQLKIILTIVFWCQKVSQKNSEYIKGNSFQ